VGSFVGEGEATVALGVFAGRGKGGVEPVGIGCAAVGAHPDNTRLIGTRRRSALMTISEICMWN
jgi:hypothetical protein